MNTLIRGVPLGSTDYHHPRWSDGTPILIDQEVRHVDGWDGFVSGVPYPEEVMVTPYSEEDVDGVECCPSDLLRVDAEPVDLTDVEF